MVSNGTATTSAIIVSSYEYVRYGIKAFLLKVKLPAITCINEEGSVEGAINAYTANPPQLIFIDDTILTPESLPEVKKLIGEAEQSIVLCLLFLNKEGGVELVKQAGAKGYFFGTIAPEDFVTSIEELLAGRYSENGDFVWIH